MPSLSVSEKTFELIAHAAMTCYSQGEFTEAEELDKIARRINAALSQKASRGPWSKKGNGITWRDVPSVLENLK